MECDNLNEKTLDSIDVTIFEDFYRLDITLPFTAEQFNDRQTVQSEMDSDTLSFEPASESGSKVSPADTIESKERSISQPESQFQPLNTSVSEPELQVLPLHSNFSKTSPTSQSQFRSSFTLETIPEHLPLDNNAFETIIIEEPEIQLSQSDATEESAALQPAMQTPLVNMDVSEKQLDEEMPLDTSVSDSEMLLQSDMQFPSLSMSVLEPLLAGEITSVSDSVAVLQSDIQIPMLNMSFLEPQSIGEMPFNISFSDSAPVLQPELLPQSLNTLICEPSIVSQPEEQIQPLDTSIPDVSPVSKPESKFKLSNTPIHEPGLESPPLNTSIVKESIVAETELQLSNVEVHESVAVTEPEPSLNTSLSEPLPTLGAKSQTPIVKASELSTILQPESQINTSFSEPSSFSKSVIQIPPVNANAFEFTPISEPEHLFEPSNTKISGPELEFSPLSTSVSGSSVEPQPEKQLSPSIINSLAPIPLSELKPQNQPPNIRIPGSSSVSQPELGFRPPNPWVRASSSASQPELKYPPSIFSPAVMSNTTRAKLISQTPLSYNKRCLQIDEPLIEFSPAYQVGRPPINNSELSPFNSSNEMKENKIPKLDKSDRDESPSDRDRSLVLKQISARTNQSPIFTPFTSMMTRFKQLSIESPFVAANNKQIRQMQHQISITISQSPINKTEQHQSRVEKMKLVSPLLRSPKLKSMSTKYPLRSNSKVTNSNSKKSPTVSQYKARTPVTKGSRIPVLKLN